VAHHQNGSTTHFSGVGFALSLGGSGSSSSGGGGDGDEEEGGLAAGEEEASPSGHPPVVSPEDVGAAILRRLLDMTAAYLGHRQVGDMDVDVCVCINNDTTTTSFPCSSPPTPNPPHHPHKTNDTGDQGGDRRARQVRRQTKTRHGGGLPAGGAEGACFVLLLVLWGVGGGLWCVCPHDCPPRPAPTTPNDTRTYIHKYR
jgi:hypothetical protein